MARVRYMSLKEKEGGFLRTNKMQIYGHNMFFFVTDVAHSWALEGPIYVSEAWQFTFVAQMTSRISW